MTKKINKNVNKTTTITPKHIPSPSKVYTSNIGRTRVPSLIWERPEWDLSEMGRILDTESYVRRAFRNKRNLWLKEGYEFTGYNRQRVEYIKKRIQQIEMATGIPFPGLMNNIIWSLIRTSNAFIVKVRNYKRSGGKKRRLGSKTIDPVAGYFILSPETIRFKRDEYGTIKKYEQHIYGKEPKEFDPEDIIHFYLDKREGFAVGTPVLVSVKDDIRALRRIEENVELLVYQHLFPLFHYKVGTEDAPAEVLPDGTNEVEIVQMKVQSMPTDGCWVTPERHSIEVLGAEGNALAVDNVIAHFKQRIFTGLGVSSVDMGEGGTSNRSTAQTMSRNLIDDTKADQRDFGSQFYSYVIQELLLESTYNQDSLFTDENKVTLKFKEIDAEARIAKENHYVDIFDKNAITHNEMRIAMGYKPFKGDAWPTSTKKSEMVTKGDGDYAFTQYGLFGRDKIILQSLDEPGTDEAKDSIKALGTKTAAEGKKTTAETGQIKKENNSTSSNKTITNKIRPTNQHTTRIAPKLNKDIITSFLELSPLNEEYDNIMSKTLHLIKEQNFTYDTFCKAFSIAKDRLVNLSKKAYRIGIAEHDIEITTINIKKINNDIEKHTDESIGYLTSNMFIALNKNLILHKKLFSEDKIITKDIFQIFNHMPKIIDITEIENSYKLGLQTDIND